MPAPVTRVHHFGDEESNPYDDGSGGLLIVPEEPVGRCDASVWEQCRLPHSQSRRILQRSIFCSSNDHDNAAALYTNTNCSLSQRGTATSFSNSQLYQQRHNRADSTTPCRFTDPFSRSRRLLQPSLPCGQDMTAASSDLLPGSPPDLTSSRSSKSFHSSLDELAEPTDTSHFEDISLKEMALALPDDYARFDHGGLGEQRRNDRGRNGAILSSPSISGQRMTSQSQPSRDLMGMSRPRYPSLGAHIQNASVEQRQHRDHNPPKRAQTGLEIPRVRAQRRGLSNPSSPTTGVFQRSVVRSQSTSRPTSSHAHPPFHPSSSNQSLARSISPLRQQRSVVGKPPVRRGSSNTSRKTTKELEDEYHDSDEEVPEDAFIWNVPLSPRPSHQRSASQSPDRDASLQATRPATTQAKHASAPSILPNGRTNSSPRVTRRSGSWQSPAFATSPEEISSPYRQKSWTAALSELSEEAKVLTEALEVYAGEQERKHGEQGKGSARPERRSASSQRAKTQSMELPPLRKGNVMIDPLPASKEKEKFLTRTRPSWLPPKNPKEEKKHLKQYQQMMAHSLEAEKRRAAKIEQDRLSRVSTESSLSRIWDQHVIPNWSAAISEPRTRELWWRGVAPRSRAVVWSRAIGNDLALTEASYEAALGRARAAEARIAGLGPEDRKGCKEANWFEAIERDVEDTFPELQLFRKGETMHEALVDVLKAYAMYRSDVGYVFGTHLPAALLTLVFHTPHESFANLANLLNRALPLSFLTADAGAISRVYSLVMATLAYKRPALHDRLLNTLRLAPSTILEPLFRSLFLARCGIESAARIWDIFVFEGDRALIRAAVGVLLALESRLWGDREEVLDTLGWKKAAPVWDLGGEESVISFVREAGKADGKEVGRNRKSS